MRNVMGVQLLTALFILPLWLINPTGGFGEFVGVGVMCLWAIANFLGVVVVLVFGVIVSGGGLIHADIFDGLVGYAVLIGFPTFVSLVISGVLWFRVSKKRAGEME